jgi:Alw26I/Eco31I/Esp3I family type II restriction endonuclease
MAIGCGMACPCHSASADKNMGKKAEYGRGHQEFLDYVQFIVAHPSYAEMPDLYTDDGDIQWEAPSNRQTGKYKDTHHKRRDWWRRKAIEIGIDPNSPHWISRAAKTLHPTKDKPCKKCGRLMNIRYAYPAYLLLKRIRQLDYIDESFPLDPLEHIRDLITRLVEQIGERVFDDLPTLLKAGSVTIPSLEPKLEVWLAWINDVYIPSEPSTLSPGAMSNAPDRLDGFHSFNRCCRGEADKGRSRENLQSYTTDRRVFEYWVDGDWVAADRLMGLIRSAPLLQKAPCLNNHPGPCAADHIGPISLGFAHRPEFQLLCRQCNSAKNNRMWRSDVALLRTAEERGERVSSWYSQRLWDLRKKDVVSEETALRLSKLLRDNRHTVMFFLDRISKEGHLTFLATFLGLPYADYDVTFVDLRIEGHVTHFADLEHSRRATKYASEQKARRLRVAFTALRDYVRKENRNAFVISDDDIERRISAALNELEKKPKEIVELDRELLAVITAEAVWNEERARELVGRIPSLTVESDSFTSAKRLLREAMDIVAQRLSDMWGHERYVRTAKDDIDFSPLPQSNGEA